MRWGPALLIALAGAMAGQTAPAQQIEQNQAAEVLVPEGEPASILDGVEWPALGTVTSLAFSPDGRLLAMGSDFQMIRLWDVATGRELRRFEGYPDSLGAVAFTPDGTRLVTSQAPSEIAIWDIKTGSKVRTLQGHTSAVNSIVLGLNGRRLVSGSSDKTARLWDMDTGVELRTFEGHEQGLTSVALSPDGARLASGSWDKTVRLWDVETGRALVTLTTHSSKVDSVAFSPDGRMLASGSQDATIRVYHLDTQGMQPLPILTSAGAHTVAFSPDGRLLAAAMDDGKVEIWNAANLLSKVRAFDEDGAGSTNTLAFSPDGRLLVVGSTLRDLASGEKLRRFEGSSTPVQSVAFDLDGHTLASISVNSTIRRWDIDGLELSRIPTQAKRQALLSPDGRCLASAGPGYTVDLSEVATGRELATLASHGPVERTGTFDSLTFNRDGRLFAAAAGFKIYRWAALTVTPPLGRVGKACNSCTPRSLCHAPPSTATGMLLDSVVESGDSLVTCIALTEDDRLLASGHADGTTRLWDMVREEPVGRIKGPDSIVSLAFAPGDGTLATVTGEGDVHLWDVATKRKVLQLRSDAGKVRLVAFSADAKVLAGTLWDGKVVFWDARTGRELRRFEHHTKVVNSVVFSADGEKLATGSADGSVLLWPWRASDTTPTIVRGAPAGWLATRPDHTVFRHDDGRFLYRKRADGSLQPVPPPLPASPAQLQVQARVTAHPGDGPEPGNTKGSAVGEVLLNVTNAPGAGRAYWLRVEAVDPPPGLLLLPPANRMRLDPGDHAELKAGISWVSSTDPPVPAKTTLRLKIVHAHGETSPIELPLSLRAPRLEWTGTPSVADRTLRLTILNTGDQTTGPVWVSAAFHAEGNGEISAEGRSLLELPAERSVDVTFPIPPAAAQASEFSVDLKVVAPISINYNFVEWIRYPPRTWLLTRANLRASSPWTLYGAIAFGGMLLAAGLAYVRIYRNPVVVRTTKLPEQVKQFPLVQLKAVDQALQKARRRDSTLMVAKVSLERWNRAIEAAESGAAAIDAFARAVGAMPGNMLVAVPSGTTAREIRLPPLTLRFAQDTAIAAIEGRDLEAGPANALAAAIHQDGAGPGQALILDLTQKQQAREKLLEMPGVRLVVLSADRLRDLILSEHPVDVLEATLVEQVQVADLSPYQTAGGVEQDALFFGRERELRSIADRTLRNFILVGARQMGKSTLLKALHRRLLARPDLEVFYLTLADGDIAYHIQHHLAPDTERSPISPDAFLKLASGAEGRPRLWLIDEADQFVIDDARRDYALAKAMRKLAQDGRAYFVLAGFWELYAATLLDNQHPLLNFAEVIRLGPLDVAAATKLATKPMEALGLAWDSPDTVSELLRGTGRRANLIVLACKALIESLGPDTRTLTRERLAEVVRSDSDLREQLRVLRRYSPLDRAIVYQCFLMNAPTQAEVRTALKAKGVDASGAELEQAFDRLALGYVLLAGGEGRLECPVPFIRELVESEGDLEARLQDHVDDWAKSSKDPRRACVTG